MINGRSYIHHEIISESLKFFLSIKSTALLTDVLAEHIVYNVLDADHYLIECVNDMSNSIKSNKIRRVKVTDKNNDDIYYYIVDCRNADNIKVYNITASYKKIFLKNLNIDIKQNSLSNYLKNYNWTIVYKGPMQDICIVNND